MSDSILLTPEIGETEFDSLPVSEKADLLIDTLQKQEELCSLIFGDNLKSNEKAGPTTHREVLMALGVEQKKFLNDSIEGLVISEMAKHAKNGCYFLDDVIAEIFKQSFCRKIYPCTSVGAWVKSGNLHNFKPNILILDNEEAVEALKSKSFQIVYCDFPKATVTPDFLGKKIIVLVDAIKPNGEWQNLEMVNTGRYNRFYLNGEMVLEDITDDNLLAVAYDKKRTKEFIRKNANRFLVKKKLFDSIE